MKLKKHIDGVLENPEVLSVFGLILFTDEHPNVVKVLRDNDYWQQFDELSGNNFAIFSVKPKPMEFVIPGRDRGPELPKGTMSFMVPTWRDPPENRKLLRDFGLKDTKKLPRFLVFAQLPDDVILQCSLQLSDESQDAAHSRLKHVITIASEAAGEIADCNKKYTESVYNAIASRMNEAGERDFLVPATKWIPFVAKVKGWLT